MQMTLLMQSKFMTFCLSLSGSTSTQLFTSVFRAGAAALIEGGGGLSFQSTQFIIFFLGCFKTQLKTWTWTSSSSLTLPSPLSLSSRWLFSKPFLIYQRAFAVFILSTENLRAVQTALPARKKRYHLLCSVTCYSRPVEKATSAP